MRRNTIIAFYKNNNPVGFYGFEDKADRVQLSIIGVVKEERGTGITYAMMRDLFRRTKDKAIITFTNTKNTRAIIYYLKNGFEIFDIKRNYLHDGEDRVFLKYKK